MKNVKTWKCLVKACGAASDLLTAMDEIEAHDKDFYKREKLAVKQEKVLAIVNCLQGLHLWYGQQIDSGSDDF